MTGADVPRNLDTRSRVLAEVEPAAALLEGRPATVPDVPVPADGRRRRRVGSSRRPSAM